jgi:membrane protein DedA with SNARE-associated domain
LVERILNLQPLLVYLLVPALVFAEDALFVGFVIPGETAAVLGGVVASRGNVRLWLIALLVVGAAIVGDAVGYQVGRHIGPRLLQLRMLRNRRQRLEEAQETLRRRGGSAVFFGRFVAFFRAVMPALAGAARMPYRRFLVYNAAGGIVWGVGFVLVGFAAGNSYKAVQRTVGRGTAVIVAVAVVSALVAWRVRAHRSRADGVS